MPYTSGAMAGAGVGGLAKLPHPPRELKPGQWVQNWIETLVGHGYDGYKSPGDAFWGMRYARPRPDGNGVDLFSPLPGA